MSATIDQKIVEMKFDNRDFERNAKTSMSTLDKLKEKLNFKSASKGLEDLQNASDKVNFSETYNGVNRLIPQFNALYTVANRVFERLTDKAIDLVKAMSVDQVTAGMAKYEQEVSSVQTIMAATGKDIEAVTEQVERLSWFSDETSYSFSDMIDNVGKFTASGVELESAVTAMQGIANWAAISGQNTNAAARAMYNLSQALGTGSVKAIDWKSIENANMATKDFKENALEAAAAVGTLIEKADGKYILASQEKAFKKASKNQKKNWNYITALNFRDSLKNDWFSAEVLERVLTEYGAYGEAVKSVQEALRETGKELTASGTMRYIEKIFGANNQGKTAEDIAKIAKELNITNEEATALVSTYSSVGRAAFKAAQEAKTWGDAVNATKDAVSSQFMLMFKNIFGDYQDAKVLFTDMANEMWEVFAGPLEAFSEQLGDALYHKSSWKDLIDQFNELGISAEDYQKKLLEQNKEFKVTIGEEDYSLQQLIEKFGSLEKVTERGYLSTDQLSNAFKDLSSNTKVSSESLQSINNNLDLVSQKGGRIKLIESFGNLYKYLKGIAGIISKSFGNIFGSLQSSKIVEMIDKFYDFTKSLDSLEEGSETVRKLQAGFDGIFSLFRAFAKLIGTIITPVKELARVAAPILKDLFLDIFEKSGNTIKKLSETLEQIFDEIRNDTTEFFSDITESDAYKNVEKFIEKIKKAFGDLGKTIEEYVGTIDIKKIANDILYFVGGILGGINAVLTSDTVSTFIGKVAGSIKKLWNSIKEIKLPTWNEVWQGIQDFFKNFSGFFSTFNFNFSSAKELFKFIKDTIFAKLKYTKDSFINRIILMYEDNNSVLRKVIDFLFNFFAGIRKILNSIASISFDDIVLAAKKILELGVLFGMFKALLSLSGLFDALSAKLKGDGKQSVNVVDFLKLLGILIAEVSVVIYAFSKMDQRDLEKALLGFTYLMVVLIATAALISKATKNNTFINNTSTAWTLISLAITIKAVADVLVKLQDYKFNPDAVLALGLAMAGIVLVMQRLGNLKSIASAAAILSFVTALNLLLGIIESYNNFNWIANVGGLIALGIMMTIMVAIIKRLNDVDGVASKVQIVGLVLALKLLVGIVIDLGSIKKSVLERGIAGLLGISLIITSFYALFTFVNKKLSGNVVNNINVNLGAFVGLVGLLLACAAVIVILGTVPEHTLKQGIVVLGVIMAGISGMLLAMKSIKGVDTMPIIAMLIGMTAIVVAIGFIFDTLLKHDFKKVITVGGVLVGAIGVLALIIKTLAIVAPVIASMPFTVLGASVLKIGAFLVGMVAVMGAVAELVGEIGKIPRVKETLETAVDIATLIGKVVGELVGNILGSTVGAITDSFPRIAENLSKFIEKLGPFLDAFKGDSPLSSGSVSEFIKAISTLGSNLKSITGNIIYLDRLPTVAAKLSTFVKALSDNNFFSVLGEATDAEIKAVDSLGKIVTAVSDLPSDSGLTRFWSGKPDYSIFEPGGGFEQYINALTTFLKNIKNVEVNDKTTSGISDLMGVAGKVNELVQTGLPKIGGFKGAWEGELDYTAFSENGSFTKYVTGLKDMIFTIGTFNIDPNTIAKVKLFSDTAGIVTGLTKNLAGTETSNWEHITGKKNKLIEYTEAVNNFAINFQEIFKNIKFLDDNYDFWQIRKTFGNIISLSYVFENLNATDTINTFTNFVKKVIGEYSTILMNELETQGNKLWEKGRNAANNLINGFTNTFNDPLKIKQVTIAAKNLADAFVNKFNFVMKIASPSKVMAQAGEYTVAGFVNQLNGSLGIVSRAGANVGNASIQGLNSAIMKSGEIFDTRRGELSPVIRPVVDLTNVARGEKQINSMLTDNPMYDLVSSRGMSLSSSINIQNGNVGVVGAINDLQNKFDSLLDGIRGMNVVMDSGALVGSISNDMDKALGTISTYKGRGNA